ncbi:hypothetical protein V8G54_001679 [Vigna mungo]|uniref:Uncharacterized protein n=1 Tax=Vigna mungo TaxID=3915 RepID=A0AAQ3P8R0_VIGMU
MVHFGGKEKMSERELLRFSRSVTKAQLQRTQHSPWHISVTLKNDTLLGTSLSLSSSRSIQIRILEVNFIEKMSVAKKLIRCVILDLDDTLLNTDGIVGNVLKVLLGKYRLKLPLRLCRITNFPARRLNFSLKFRLSSL